MKGHRERGDRYARKQEQKGKRIDGRLGELPTLQHCNTAWTGRMRWMRCDGCRGTDNEKIKDLASLFCMNKAAGCAFFFFFF